MSKIEKKGPCQADPRCRRGAGFYKKSTNLLVLSMNLTFYPTPMDATDTFYPMEPPKPIF